MSEVHFIQRHILNSLLFSEVLTFSELNTEKLENSQFNFHLKSLISAGYINKLEHGYTLSNKGKEYANRLDTDKKMFVRHPKVSVLIVPRLISEDSTKILAFTRLKHPFYGHQGFISGKINYGESFKETAKRELTEETGLSGEPVLVAVRHYLVYDKNNYELLEDKIFFIHKIDNPTGELVESKEGKNEWVDVRNLKEYYERPFNTVESILEVVADCDQDGIQFREVVQYTDEF